VITLGANLFFCIVVGFMSVAVFLFIWPTCYYKISKHKLTSDAVMYVLYYQFCADVQISVETVTFMLKFAQKSRIVLSIKENCSRWHTRN